VARRGGASEVAQLNTVVSDTQPGEIMSKPTLSGALLAGIAVLLLAGLGETNAVAARETAPTGSDAIVRGAHFSPDTPGVDVYLTAVAGGSTQLWLSGVGYGDVSPYRRLASGLYAVSMRPHGVAASTPPALSWTLNARAGQAYTAAAVGMNKQLHGIVLRDELTPPGAGQGLVRVIQAASRAPRATITAGNGVVVAKSAAFATSTPYAKVPAGTLPLRASSLSAPSLATTASVPVASGTVSSIVLLDGKAGGLTIRTVMDAAGAANIPAGAVPAGGGGTAVRPDTGWTGAWLLGLLVVAGAGAIALRLARVQTSR
jgi:Domain of unknown function (DUF4397)